MKPSISISKIKKYSLSPDYRFFSRHYYGGGVETIEGRDASCYEAKHLFNSHSRESYRRDDYCVYNPKTHTVFGWDSHTYIIKKQLSDVEVETLQVILKCNNYDGVKSPHKLQKLPNKWEFSQNVLDILKMVFPDKFFFLQFLLEGNREEILIFCTHLFDAGFRFNLTIVERLPQGSDIYNEERSENISFRGSQPPHKPTHIE